MTSLRLPTRITLLALGALAASACHRDGASDGGSSSKVESSSRPPLAMSVAPSASAVSPPVVEDEDPPPAKSWTEQRAYLYAQMKRHMGLTDAQVAEVASIVDASPLLGQGRPDDTTYAMTRTECRQRRAAIKDPPQADLACGAPNMVRIYDPSVGQTKADAQLCIDQFEFPDIPCEYPVTYGSSREAAQLCTAVGKRLCDAHEWEGACAGAMHSPDTEYHFGAERPYATWLHNNEREIVWAYGPKQDLGLCGTMSTKSPRCDSTGLTRCGSNDYPAGSFPQCVSTFGVYDQHGNVAEHMSLPMKPEELGARGGIGQTEMKGSWFIFGRASSQPHPDDCRWRAKDWHPSTVMTQGSHRNYHLGFRCCKDITAAAKGG